MSRKAIIAAVVVVVVGVGGAIWVFTRGSGRSVYAQGDAIKYREQGEFLLNKRRHSTSATEKADLLSQAIEQFKQALTAKPDFEVAFNMLGHCYIERGQWEDALSNLDQALKIRPDYPAALYNRGRLYQQLSVTKRDNALIDKAIADYQAAMQSELAANFIGDIHKSLADAYRQKNDYARAIEQLQLYMQKSPHAADSSTVQRKIRGLELMQQGAVSPEEGQQPGK